VALALAPRVVLEGRAAGIELRVRVLRRMRPGVGERRVRAGDGRGSVMTGLEIILASTLGGIVYVLVVSVSGVFWAKQSKKAWPRLPTDNCDRLLVGLAALGTPLIIVILAPFLLGYFLIKVTGSEK